MSRVYFIKPIGFDGPIKIGCSISPDGRRDTLQTWCPFPLEIVAEIEGDTKLERRFHLMFDDTCKGREWFDWSEIEAWIAENGGSPTMVPECWRDDFLRRAGIAA